MAVDKSVILHQLQLSDSSRFRRYMRKFVCREDK
jgi:hypothetical protein